MTPTLASSWGLASTWTGSSAVLDVYKRLLSMPVFSLLGLTLVADMSVLSFLLLSVAMLVGVYLLTSVLVYWAIVSPGDPEHPAKEAPLGEAADLVDKARQFGAGIGIEPDAWRLTAMSYGPTDDIASTIAPMPGSSAHSLVEVGRTGELDPDLVIGFLGRQPSGRVVASTFQKPMVPHAHMDWNFDSDTSAYALWGAHCALVDTDTEFTFDEYLTYMSSKNPAKEAGFRRFLLTWGRVCFKKRGLIRGYDPRRPARRGVAT